MSDAVPRLTFIDQLSMSCVSQFLTLRTWPTSSTRSIFDLYQVRMTSPLDSSKTRGFGPLIPTPEYPDCHPTSLVDCDVLAQWLAQHLLATEHALVIFTDTRPLDKVGAWKYTKRLWQHRFSRQGPQHERWRGLFVPLTSETGFGMYLGWSLCC